jgi:hypothetical protein
LAGLSSEFVFFFVGSAAGGVAGVCAGALV